MKTDTISFRNSKYIAAFLIILACACKEQSPKNNTGAGEKQAPKIAIIKKPGSNFIDTIIINSKAAVFYSPDSLQMVEIKKVNEKRIYEMLVHDCHYQMQNAHNVLKQYWPGIKVIDVSNARYLLFIKEDNSKICIDLNDKNDICGLFLFDKKKNPVLADMPNIATVLNLYFKN